MEVRELTAAQKRQFETDKGLYVSNMNNRWLYQKGIDNGFLILEINNKKISKLEDLKNIVLDDLETIVFLSPSGEKTKIALQY